MPHAKPSGDLVFPELTEDVVARIAATADARVREVMEMLIRHLHAFVREASLSHEEWRNAIEFLTHTGKMCSENRQEFVLLSDILGVSMLVDAVNNSAGTGLTDSTVLGPFYAGRQRELEPGDTILLREEDGPPLIVEGTVTSQNGDPIWNALVEVWQTAPNLALRRARRRAAGGASARQLPNRRARDFQFQLNLARQLSDSWRRACGTTSPDDGEASVQARTRPFHDQCQRPPNTSHASVSGR